MHVTIHTKAPGQSSCVDLPYDEIAARPLCALTKTLSSLNLPLQNRLLEDTLASIPRTPQRVGQEGYDLTSLVHPAHVQNGTAGRWRSELEPRTADAIWLANEDWMKRYGYTRH